MTLEQDRFEVEAYQIPDNLDDLLKMISPIENIDIIDMYLQNHNGILKIGTVRFLIRTSSCCTTTTQVHPGTWILAHIPITCWTLWPFEYQYSDETFSNIFENIKGNKYRTRTANTVEAVKVKSKLKDWNDAYAEIERVATELFGNVSYISDITTLYNKKRVKHIRGFAQLKGHHVEINIEANRWTVVDKRKIAETPSHITIQTFCLSDAELESNHLKEMTMQCS